MVADCATKHCELHVSLAQLDECPGIPGSNVRCQMLVKRREFAVPWHIPLSHTAHDREICFFFFLKDM